MIRTSYRKYKLVVLFMGIMMLIGILSGIIYHFKLDTTLKEMVVENILNLIERNEVITPNFYHIIIILFVSFLSFILMGPILGVFGLFYEGFSLGFIISVFVKEKALKGLFYGIIYILCSKLVYIILLLFLTILSFKLFRNIISKNNKNNNYYLNLCRYLKQFIIILVMVILNEFILVPILNKVCCYFSFIII